MSKRQNKKLRISKAKVTDDDRTIYGILREEFTAADLQKYTESEPMIPAEEVLEDLERIHRKTTARKKS